jgi:sterol carrier protein 2
MTSQPNAYVLGVGLTPFIKPRALRQYPELGLEACTKALLDAQLNYDDVNAGVACYCYGDTTSGQRIFYQHPHLQHQQRLRHRLDGFALGEADG